MGPAPSLPADNELPEGNGGGNRAFLDVEEELNQAVGSLICYRMVRLSAIKQWTRWKRYQDLEPHEYVKYYPIRQELGSGEAFKDPQTGATGQSKVDSKDGQAEAKKKLYFISHRWLNPDHPDPEGTQLQRVQRLPSPRPSEPLGPDPSSADDLGSSSHMPTAPEASDWKAQHDPASDVLIFYDFSSLPQEPRTADESETFKLGIRGLNDILSYMRVVILDDQDYMSRSWCLMEYFISSFKGSLILDENRDTRMHQLQQLAVVPNQGIGYAKSAIAEAEAIRGSRMGDIAMSFFAESFKHSSVTKGTDRRAIEDVFRTFIRDNIRAWKYEPYVGWKPAWLQADQVDRILRGERLRLIDLPHTGIPVFKMPTDINSIVPQAAYDNERETLEPFWGRILALRGGNALARYFLLNDPVAHKEWDMVKKTNI
ncbi:hypothetical protein BO78DRAFT_387993 [Aspergillus sclerotiicarbonarius CBS 121057]|uniref:Uncharacterized protein n=1 Tax=Aspergillus sclerotiicarbonarius (strain CBS 121057 / IBT 28362) TaxID=1448318 RepID=A0A319EF36_ASPSB|nr:hypothetical protein BO78DRAFT_387993 [Aspergillus sclerotiicarbonarius CBS 121057]